MWVEYLLELELYATLAQLALEHKLYDLVRARVCIYLSCHTYQVLFCVGHPVHGESDCSATEE